MYQLGGKGCTLKRSDRIGSDPMTDRIGFDPTSDRIRSDRIKSQTERKFSTLTADREMNYLNRKRFYTIPEAFRALGSNETKSRETLQSR